MSEDQERIPLEQRTKDGEQLPQPGLEEAEATSERALGQVEGQIHRLKLLKRQSYGRAGFDLLRHRVLARSA